jgi:hypothetical protein
VAVALTVAQQTRGQPLASYFFHIIETNRRLEDEEGEDLPTLEAAIEQTEQIIREILESEGRPRFDQNRDCGLRGRDPG